MKLTHLAIIAVRGSRGIVTPLAQALKVAESSVYKYIRDNSSELTKAAALAVIRRETGLTDEQILTDQEVTA